MKHLIDSDWVADFLAGRPPAVALVRKLIGEGPAFSVVSYVEVMEGVRGSRHRAAMESGFRTFLVGVEVLDFTTTVATRAADIRLELRANKRQVNERAMDLLIAATAIEHGLTLVTRNAKHYADIPSLRLYPTA